MAFSSNADEARIILEGFSYTYILGPLETKVSENS